MRYGFGVLALIGGCLAEPPADDGGQFGEEDAACRAVERTALGLDDESPLGFTPRVVLDTAVGRHQATLRWEQLGEVTGLEVAVAQAEGGAVEFVDYEYVDENGDPSPMEIGCLDQVEIEVQVDVNSEDGQLAESFSGRLTTGQPEESFFVHDLGEVTGSFDPWDHAPADHDYDDIRAWISLQFFGVVSGTIDGQGSGSSGNDPDSVAYAEHVRMGTIDPVDGE